MDVEFVGKKRASVQASYVVYVSGMIFEELLYGKAGAGLGYLCVFSGEYFPVLPLLPGCFRLFFFHLAGSPRSDGEKQRV